MKLAAVCLLLSAAGPWFSHKRHAPLKLECMSCHAGAQKSVRAGMPPAARCHACHQAMVLRRPFQAEYDNLPDYVIFSHGRHAQAKIECAACHGDVTRQDQPGPSSALNMKACVDCHKAHNAKVACNLCHELGQ